MLIKQFLLAALFTMGSVTANPVANPDNVEIEARDVGNFDIEARDLGMADEGNLVARDGRHHGHRHGGHRHWGHRHWGHRHGGYRHRHRHHCHRYGYDWHHGYNRCCSFRYGRSWDCY
ncbi:hypothetical protein HRG_006690 [Hirsutella rhossiliensis]|uniref:Uncharacterized protein n=1 Tax=Hirsutella rhossiliensis TaxID=111463 RepID=A0A9P8MUU8_9HYPO|nr:uncharacterized protein HRG_06690 [Hirsutella rhossiliensis]KAH0962588.1 hypothetical protein HRG_06690 [Hirsutella rhossiliensis]